MQTWVGSTKGHCFTRWYCHEEMNAAREAGLHTIVVKEEDKRFGRPDIALEKERAMTLTARDGSPLHEFAAENLKLLDDVCFIPRRTQQHELNGYLDEIIKQGIVDSKLARQVEPEAGREHAEEDADVNVSVTVS